MSDKLSTNAERADSVEGAASVPLWAHQIAEAVSLLSAICLGALFVVTMENHNPAWWALVLAALNCLIYCTPWAKS